MEIKQIPLQLVHPSPMNPRKTFDQEAVEELADNIAKQGLLQPITVRPIPLSELEIEAGSDAEYEIVCGERRYRAMSHLDSKDPLGQYTTIAAIVRDMTDTEAFDAMITENLQRKDVDPIEEAFAFGQLIKRGDSIEEIALRFGKSQRFIADRVKLNAIIPELMVEIRDGNMSISAAMLISKLEPEQQRDFYKRNKGMLNKMMAERYVSNLFMMLNTSLWALADEPDFPGTTCGKSCRECEYNICNHGCLFYEMKADAKNAKCTNRARFTAKTEEYCFHVIDKYADRLVKVGEPLAKGKMVVGVNVETYMPESDKNAMRAIEDKVRAKGYEVINANDHFRGRVFYDLDDERTQKFLEDGDAYLVLDMYNYTSLSPKLRAYYLKKGDVQTNCSPTGIPSKVVELMNEYKRENVPADYAVALSTAIGNNAEATINALNETEKVAICAALLQDNPYYRHKNGIGNSSDDELLEYVKKNIATCFNSILRAYLIDRLKSNNNPVMHTIRTLLPNLGKMWAEEACEKAVKDTDSKRDKKLKKLTKQLADLGYSTSGHKLIKPTTPTPEELQKQYEELKQKHPDAILLFRVGDFYEIFGEDAVNASKTLGLTLTKRKDTPLCGFPHHAIDTYLPKLVRAGLRAAICEELTDPKKK